MIALDRLVQDPQEPHAERDDAEARREGHRPAGRGACRRSAPAAPKPRSAWPPRPLRWPSRRARSARRPRGRTCARACCWARSASRSPSTRMLDDALGELVRPRAALRRDRLLSCSGTSRTARRGGRRSVPAARAVAGSGRPAKLTTEPGRRDRAHSCPQAVRARPPRGGRPDQRPWPTAGIGRAAHRARARRGRPSRVRRAREAAPVDGARAACAS